MSKFQVLDGAITALITPYSLAGEIDYPTFRNLLHRQIGAGIRAVVVAGTTGEGHLLTDNQMLELIKFAVEESKSQLAVIGNTGGLCTKKAVERTAAGFEAGMVASLQVPPYYGKTSTLGCAEHLKALLDIGPGIIYNVPARTNYDLDVSQILALASHGNFLGVKECAGIDRMSSLSAEGIPFWSGNDEQAHIARHELKSKGMISVVGNILPAVTVNLMKGNSQHLKVILEPLLELLGCEPNPIVIKTLLGLTGAIQPVFRLPYVPLIAEKMIRSIEILNAIDPDLLVGESPRLVDFKIVL